MSKNYDLPGDMGHMNADRELVASRIVPAWRKLVFKAWTDPECLAQWWGPDDSTNTILQMDVRAGGAWKMIMHAPDGAHYRNESIYIEVKEPERLVYAHITGPKFVSTIVFEEADGGTNVIMRMLFETPEEFDRAVKTYGIAKGAQQNFDRLESYLVEMN